MIAKEDFDTLGGCKYIGRFAGSEHARVVLHTRRTVQKTKVSAANVSKSLIKDR